MLEYWNDGIMGDLVLSNVKEGKAGSGLLAKFLLIWKLIMLIDNELPFNPLRDYGGLRSIFRYSIIPCAGQNVRPQKLPLISAGYRISETFNYSYYSYLLVCTIPLAPIGGAETPT